MPRIGKCNIICEIEYYFKGGSQHLFKIVRNQYTWEYKVILVWWLMKSKYSKQLLLAFRKTPAILDFIPQSRNAKTKLTEIVQCFSEFSVEVQHIVLLSLCLQKDWIALESVQCKSVRLISGRKGLSDENKLKLASL